MADTMKDVPAAEGLSVERGVATCATLARHSLKHGEMLAVAVLFLGKARGEIEKRK